MANRSSKEGTKSLIPRIFRAGARQRQECAACSLRALLSFLKLALLVAPLQDAEPRLISNWP